jgi:hypothetical protein
MLATSDGSQSMADRVLGMCSVPKPPVPCAGCAGQLCSNNPVGCGQNSVESQTSEQPGAATCLAWGMTFAPRTCAVCLDTLVLLYQVLHTQCVLLSAARTLYPCYSQNSLQQQRCAAGMWRIKHDLCHVEPVPGHLQCRLWIAPELVGCCKNPVITLQQPDKPAKARAFCNCCRSHV